MNKQRLKRKLEFLLDTFEEEAKPRQKKHLLGKINEVEKLLGIELTVMDIKVPKDAVMPPKEAYVKNKKFIEEIKVFTEEDIDRLLMQSLTAEEQAYMKAFESWIKNKREEVVNMHSPKKSRSNEKLRLNELLLLSNQGYTATDISKMFNCHQSAITKRQHKHFDKVYKVSDNKVYKPIKDNWNGLSPKILCRMLNEGHTDTSIAKHFNIPQPKVTQLKNKMIFSYYKFKEENK